MNESRLVLTLLGRDGCHLCEEMRAELDAKLVGLPIAIHEIDITGDAALEARYAWSIPVLLVGDEEICRHYLDEAALTSWLSKQGALIQA